MTAALSVADLDRARLDPVVFAELLVGQPLWPHQVEVVRSQARYRVLCAGRRSGKTRVYGVLALHRAFSVPRSKVLIVSASDTSAKRMFADLAGMARQSKHLQGSLEDESTRLLTLSNYSTIECVPASMKAVRSAEADLLIVDEAGFVDQDIWEAAEPVVGARPGARVLIASTPWRGPGHFFHDLWQQGMRTPDAEVMSWHWPSTVSPMVDQEWLEGVRSRSASAYFEREYLAEWGSTSGLLLTPDELMGCVLDYPLIEPGQLDDHRFKHVSWWNGGQSWRVPGAVAGLDWGAARDAHALVIVSALDDQELNVPEGNDPGDYVFFVPWLEVHERTAYDVFVNRVLDVAKGYNLISVASETNGVGAYPTERLGQLVARGYQMGEIGPVLVAPVWTDNRRKQSMFGMVKGMLQAGRLVLPRHPELLKQLGALEMSQLPSGSIAIAVPESRGHDDLAMALAQAVSSITHPERSGQQEYPDREIASTVALPVGTKVPLPVRMLQARQSFALSVPSGVERDGAAW